MEQLHYLLMKANAALSRRILAGAAGLGLTPGQPKVLECLRVLEEADQKTIAAHCEIEQATVGSILYRMEQSGLVVRRQREGDRRALWVSLTGQGRALSREMAQIFAQSDRAAAADLTEEELHQLKGLLAKVAAAAGRRDEA